jgi:DNA-directed RNA polymerase subunit RPC12/RpoP
MINGFEVKARLTKACPYCGSRNIVTIAPKAYRDNGLRCNWITCEDCGARVSGYSNDEGDYNTAYREALKVWNRRAS